MIQSKSAPDTKANSGFSLGNRTILTALVAFILIPFTLWFSWYSGGRNYYGTSLLIIIYTVASFFFAFERRKPQARELVLLAVLCTIAVVSRTVFIWVPHFKPIGAIIIITGIVFGPEAGFMTGAISIFASDFLFGQGMWTPWQMFAFGLAGFLAGLFYRWGFLKKEKKSLCVFGLLFELLLIGPILDTSTLLSLRSAVTWESAAAVYLSGLPVNLVRASATVLALLFLSRPMFEKLERVKIKYGMMSE